MNKHKLGKAKNSVNELDANKSSSGVSNTTMSIMYKLSNLTSETTEMESDGKENKK